MEIEKGTIEWLESINFTSHWSSKLNRYSTISLPDSQLTCFYVVSKAHANLDRLIREPSKPPDLQRTK